MITVSQIIAIIFLVLALAGVVFCACGPLKESKFKKYFLVSSVIYLTGTILILLIVFIKSEIGLTFTLISEICIFVIFVFTTFIMDRLIKNTDAIRAELLKKDQDDEKN